MKRLSKKQYSFGIKVVALATLFSLGMWASYARGEQAAGTPESGSTSYIKSLYTDLQTSGYGSDTAAPDWGTYWNRVKTSAQWTPDGTASASDVVSGKTFFGSDRTQQTGTLVKSNPGNCPTQAYSDYGSPGTQADTCVDTIVWTVPSDGITGTEKKDPVSGLIWSASLHNNSGTIEFTPVGNLASAWSWDGTAAANVAVGNKTAITLCSNMGSGWRLPTQKEMLQGYIDGANYNLTKPDYAYWSATTESAPYSWSVNMSDGTTQSQVRGTTHYVRCVR